MKRVGIVGWRRWTDQDRVAAAVAALPDDATVVSGGAAGPDTWAVEAATRRGLRTIVHLPQIPASPSQGALTRAYHARNQLIVDDADELIAFVSPQRRGGTEDTIRRAQRKGIPIRLCRQPDDA